MAGDEVRLPLHGWKIPGGLIPPKGLCKLSVGDSLEELIAENFVKLLEIV